jgi:hypothetical protein
MLAAPVVPGATILARVDFRTALVMALVVVAAFVVFLAAIVVFALVDFGFALVMALVVVAAFVVFLAAIVIFALIDFGPALVMALIVVATLVVLFATIVVFALINFRFAVVVPPVVLPALIVFAAFVVSFAFVRPSIAIAFALCERLLCSKEAATDYCNHREEERTSDIATSFRLHNFGRFWGFQLLSHRTLRACIRRLPNGESCSTLR